MIAVITGDIVNSRSVSPEAWQPHLKSFLEDKIKDTSKWEIYRGDSFQIETAVDTVLELALSIKALVKHSSNIDVRMSIGIGEQAYTSAKVTQSYGAAFILSGEAFEELRDKTLHMKTNDKDFDDYFYPILRLVSFIADQWKPATAEAMFYVLSNKNMLQKEIAVLMNKDSTTVNKALKRAAYDEINDVLKLYANKVKQCFSSSQK